VTTDIVKVKDIFIKVYNLNRADIPRYSVAFYVYYFVHYFAPEKSGILIRLIFYKMYNNIIYILLYYYYNMCSHTSTDWGPRSTKSPRNKKSAFGGRPATSNTRSRSPNWPCKSPTTLIGARNRSSMGCRRNARRASTHRARMRGSSQRRPAAPNRPSTMSSSVQCRRDMSSICTCNVIWFLVSQRQRRSHNKYIIWVTKRPTAKFIMILLLLSSSSSSLLLLHPVHNITI